MKSARLVALAVLVAGCGSDFRTAAPSVRLQDVPGELAAVLCERQLACSPFLAILGGTQQVCTTEWENRIRQGGYDAIIEAVEEGRTEYEGAKAAACVDAWRKTDCSELHVEPDVCREVFRGAVPRGGECTIDQECSGDSICSFADACPGTCVARLAAGEVCDGSDERCAEGLVCSEATNRCAQPGRAGDPCGAGVEAQCAGTLQCAGERPVMGTPGVCTAPEDVFAVPEGESCDLDAGRLCQLGLACVLELSGEPPQFVCRALREDGSCNAGFPAQCQPGAYCAGIDLAQGDVEGTCTPLPTANEPCVQGPLELQSCALGLLCVEGTCRTYRDNGQSCRASVECYSGHCAEGGCAAPNVCE